MNPVPVIVTDDPTAPLVGVKLAIVGAAFETFTASDTSELLPRLSVAIAVSVWTWTGESAVGTKSRTRPFPRSSCSP